MAGCHVSMNCLDIARKLLTPFLAALFLSLSGCHLPAGQTVVPTINVTQAYQTVEARLTQAVAQTPPAATADEPSEATPTPSPTTPTPAYGGPTPTPPQPTAPSGDGACDQAAPGTPIDVTIPDYTQLLPGEEFTKTWRLVNAGTCTWTDEYALVWFSGEKMNAPGSVPLAGPVPPGQMVDLSVDMEAPEKPGSYISYWKLRNAAGVLFGIGPSGGSAFWVNIEVIAAATTTATPATPTQTSTASPTPGVQASGPALLRPGDALDLDANRLNAGEEDLLYRLAGQEHVLEPAGSAALAVFGAAGPSLGDCQTATLSADPLTIDGLAAGTYLCYRTNMALPGWAKIAGLAADTGEVSLEIYTWKVP